MRAERKRQPRWEVLDMLRQFFIVCFPAIQAISHAQVPMTVVGFPRIAVVVPDQMLFDIDRVRWNEWGPYTSAFGDGSMLLSTNIDTGSDFGVVTERAVVAFFSHPNSVTESEGFFSDTGEAWVTNNDVASPDRGPPRVAGDKRDGLSRYKYILASECTPWAFPIQNPSFVAGGFSYDAQVASFQLLERTPTLPVPLSFVTDPLYGKATSGAQNGKPTLFGGEIRCLSNGNFAVVIEDRTGNTVPVDRASLATIVDGQDGSATIGEVIIGPFNANQGVNPAASTGIWSNMAAYNGGLAIRPHTGTEDASGYLTIGFWDNQANPLGTWPTIVRTDPSSPLAPAGGFTTSIAILSGTETRIDSDIRSGFVYMAGRGVDSGGDPDGGVYVTKIDAKTRTTTDEVYATEGLTVEPHRVTVCSDKYDNVFVCWSDTSNTGNLQVAGRLYDANLDPLTDAFLVFENSELGPETPNDFSVKRPSCSMVDGRILVAGSVDIDSATLGYLRNDALAVVLSVDEVLPSTPTPTATQPPEPTATMDPRSDIHEDGTVDAKDLLILMSDWMKVTGG